MSDSIPPKPAPNVVTSVSLTDLTIREILDHLSTRCSFLFVSGPTNETTGLYYMQTADAHDAAYLFGVLTAHYHMRMMGALSHMNSAAAQQGTDGSK